MTMLQNRLALPLAVAAFCASIILGAPSALFAAKITGLWPTVASQHTESLIIKGAGWGQYDDRGEPRIFLIPGDEGADALPLTLERNYRDCSFVVGEKIIGKCTMDEGDMLLRVVLPQNLAEGDYYVQVITQNDLVATVPFFIIRLPDFSNTNRPIMATNPTSGPVGAHVLFTAGGFPKRTGLFLKFDGVKQKGIFYTDDKGFVAEASFVIPRSISKDFKVITITPGKHSVELNDGSGHFQTITFTVTEKEETEPRKDEKEKEKKEEEEKAKKEQEDKQKTDQEKKQKEEEQKKGEQGEQKKGEKQKKTGEEEKKTDEKPFRGKPCDANLPRVWQEGCIDATQQQKEQKLQTQLYTPDSAGKPCKEDLAITFQPECIPQQKVESIKPFAGKICDTNLPHIWQEGCVNAPQQQKEQKPQTQLYVPDSAGKPCKEGLAITFQPGCVSQIPKAETIKPFAGKACDANLPRSWQEGCIGAQKNTQAAQTAAQVTIKPAGLQLCNPSIPTYSQTNCRRE